MPGCGASSPVQMQAEKAVVHAGEASVEISYTQAPPRLVYKSKYRMNSL